MHWLSSGSRIHTKLPVKTVKILWQISTGFCDMANTEKKLYSIYGNHLLKKHILIILSSTEVEKQDKGTMCVNHLPKINVYF